MHPEDGDYKDSRSVEKRLYRCLIHQDGQYTYDLTVRKVCVVVEKQWVLQMSLCMCACAHARAFV